MQTESLNSHSHSHDVRLKPHTPETPHPPSSGHQGLQPRHLAYSFPNLPPFLPIHRRRRQAEGERFRGPHPGSMYRSHLIINQPVVSLRMLTTQSSLPKINKLHRRLGADPKSSRARTLNCRPTGIQKRKTASVPLPAIDTRQHSGLHQPRPRCSCGISPC